MFMEKHRQRRRSAIRREEGILSSVFGEFLDPIDALFTIFYSILFALLFTLSYGILIYRGVISSSFASGYAQGLFFTLLGAVAAWGIIDGVLYVLGGILGRSGRYRLLHHVQASKSEEEAAIAIAHELDPILQPITSDEQRHALYHDIRAYLIRAEPQAVGLQRADVVGGVATLLLSVIAVLPSLLPLMLLPDNTSLAIRISSVVSLIVIFAAGYSWGRHTDTNPWKTGFIFSSVCLAMVLVAMLLGG